MRSSNATSTALFQVLDVKLSSDPAFAQLIENLESKLSAGADFAAAMRELPPAQLKALESRLGDHFIGELRMLGQERDPELFWDGVLRATRNAEAGDSTPDLPRILSAWLQNPDIDPALRRRLEAKLEASSGGGPIGARCEYFLSNFNRQAFDGKAWLPMLAAGLAGKLVQSGILGRMAVAAPAPWTRGALAKALAGTLGFGSEAGVFGAFHGHYGRSAVSLASMKAGNWIGARLGLPVPLTVVAGSALALKMEEGMGWRQSSGLGATLLEAGVTSLHFGIAYSLAARVLGPRFQELQGRLALPPWKGPVVHFASILPKPAAALAASLPAEAFPEFRKPLQMSGTSDGAGLRQSLTRSIPNSNGEPRPFEVLLSPEHRRLFLAEAVIPEGERFAIAKRDGSLLWVKLDKKGLVADGDPITPSGVTRLLLRLEEGETRGRAFLHYDSKAVTLTFIDLEEKMITEGPAMRPGTGSVFFAWLAEQAWSQGKSFNVSHITSPQTVRILERMGLMGPKCRVEACSRIDPESYDEEYRVLDAFEFGDSAKWNQHRREAEFYNVFGEAPPHKP